MKRLKISLLYRHMMIWWNCDPCNFLWLLPSLQLRLLNKLREFMQIDGLTNDEVKSHMQMARGHSNFCRCTKFSYIRGYYPKLTEDGWSSIALYSVQSTISIYSSGYYSWCGCDGTNQLRMKCWSSASRICVLLAHTWKSCWKKGRTLISMDMIFLFAINC